MPLDPAAIIPVPTAESEAFVAGLRAMADWYEAHPDMPRPSHLSVYSFGARETPDFMRRCARAMGTFEKDFSIHDLFALTKKFGPFPLRFVFTRDLVCESRVVGTRVVRKRVPPKDTVMVEEDVVEEIKEWDCPSLLGHAGP
jgi:hypothetical protein